MSTFYGTSEGTLYFRGNQIANFVPRVDCVFRDITRVAIDPPVALQVSYAITGHSEKQSMIIDYKRLDSLDFEFECPGCTCSTDKGKSTQKLVKRYIREQLGTTSLEKVDGVYYSLPGWYSHPSGLGYIDGKRIIGSEPEQPFLIGPAVEQHTLASDSALFSSESTERLLRVLCPHPNILLPAFAFTLYAALRSVLHREGLPTACALYLVGSQGFGKTTAAKRFCALWQNSLVQYANVYDAHSTEAAMRNALADARDQVVLLDDICRSSNRTTQRKRMDLAATLVRAAANEIPVTRMCGKGEETTECVASLVITGEFPLEKLK